MKFRFSLHDPSTRLAKNTHRVLDAIHCLMEYISCRRSKKPAKIIDLGGEVSYQYRFMRNLDDITLSEVLWSSGNPALWSCIDCVMKLFDKEQSSPQSMKVANVLKKNTSSSNSSTSSDKDITPPRNKHLVAEYEQSQGRKV